MDVYCIVSVREKLEVGRENISLHSKLVELLSTHQLQVRI
jgi:hypothetical protein